MKLGKDILKLMNQVYEAGSMIERRVGHYNLVFKTDVVGRPILLFVGTNEGNGKIKGERFARRLVLGPEGRVIKDHWDNKGKT